MTRAYTIALSLLGVAAISVGATAKTIINKRMVKVIADKKDPGPLLASTVTPEGKIIIAKATVLDSQARATAKVIATKQDPGESTGVGNSFSSSSVTVPTVPGPSAATAQQASHNGASSGKWDPTSSSAGSNNNGFAFGSNAFAPTVGGPGNGAFSAVRTATGQSATATSDDETGPGVTVAGTPTFVRCIDICVKPSATAVPAPIIPPGTQVIARVGVGPAALIEVGPGQVPVATWVALINAAVLAAGGGNPRNSFVSITKPDGTGGFRFCGQTPIAISIAAFNPPFTSMTAKRGP